MPQPTEKLAKATMLFDGDLSAVERARILTNRERSQGAQIINIKPGGESVDVLMNKIELTGVKTALFFMGGAGKMKEKDIERLNKTVKKIIQIFSKESKLFVGDGGTESGIMKVIGATDGNRDNNIITVGVCPRPAVALNDAEKIKDEKREKIDQQHDFIVTVEVEMKDGEVAWDAFGRETDFMYSYFNRVAEQVGKSLAIVANGGGITINEVIENLKVGRQVLVLGGTGRAADAIASVLANPEKNENEESLEFKFKTALEAAEIKLDQASKMMKVVNTGDEDKLAAVLGKILASK